MVLDDILLKRGTDMISRCRTSEMIMYKNTDHRHVETSAVCFAVVMNKEMINKTRSTLDRFLKTRNRRNRKVRKLEKRGGIL